MRNGVAWRPPRTGMSLSWTRLNKHCGFLSGRTLRKACFEAIYFCAWEQSICWGRRGVAENLPIWAAMALGGISGLRAGRINLIKEGNTGSGDPSK
jgi:hypothetical protein